MSARQSTTGSVVVIKYLSKHVSRSRDVLDRLRDETTTLADVHHPNLARAYELVESQGRAAIVREFAAGVSLRRLIDRTGPLEPLAALYVVKSALLGLTEPHRRGIVHRDVKPDNLIVDSAGDAKLVDIGLAARPGRRGPAGGDPTYLAPELWAGRPAGPSSDVYAATAVLFESLAGEQPRATDGGYLGRSDRVSDGAIAAIRPDEVPFQIRMLMSTGFAVQPEDRPAHADAMLGRLDVAAFSAYGPGWERDGKALLASQVARMPEETDAAGERPTAAVTEPRLGPARLTTRVLIALGVALALAAGTRTVLNGALNAFDSPPVVAPTHVPVVIPGPTVPPVSAVGSSGADTASPQPVTGLHVTGRAQTAVSLDWNPSVDNVKVAGYIVMCDGKKVATTYEPGYTAADLDPATKYRFSVSAFDDSGNISPPGPAVSAMTLTEPDTAPPSVPTDLRSTGRSTTSVALAWAASHDNVGVAGYDVYRDGILIATVVRPVFADSGLAPLETHAYAVRAFDASNNASGITSVLRVTTLKVPDTTPPAPPGGLAAKGTTTASIDLSWRASTDNIGVVGYLVFRDGSQIATTVGTSFIDQGLAPQTRHWYTVRAIDAAHNRSPASAAVSATTLAPPPTTPPATTPPPAELIALDLTLSPIAAPDCTTTVEATVTVSGGGITVELEYMIGGASGTSSVYFAAAGARTVVLGTGDGTVSGSATAHDTAFGYSDAESWSAPAECLPPPVTEDPTVDPTEAATEPTDF